MQFSDVNFILPQGLTGLVGDNGVGKSLLVAIIQEKIKPSLGTVEVVGSLIALEQNTQNHCYDDATIAEFTGADSKLKALKNIEQGNIDSENYQIVGDDWLFAATFTSQLQNISPRLTPYSKLSQLSGGELTKVMLWRVFTQASNQNSIVILDEPSNHLDSQSKHWLAEQLQHFNGKCLLVSHDRELLNLCQHIAELTSDGINIHASSYDQFENQQIQLSHAKAKTLKQLQTQHKKAKATAQRDLEKAQKRSSQGTKKAAKGGIPKVLLGAKQQKAENSQSSKSAQHQNKQNLIQQQIQNAELKENSQPIQFTFTQNGHKAKRLLRAHEFVIPFTKNTISLEVQQGQKWHLEGENGSGKSTFLGILNQIALLNKHPELQQYKRSDAAKFVENIAVNTQFCWLDQHCSIIQKELNLLENIAHFCPQLSQSQQRTLLASNGFRRDKVFQKAQSLSGGEKMRLAMLIASHQQDCLLLLDEPDNHLDISSKNILADALSRYSGSFILVSHDASFVAKCGITNSFLLQ